MRKTSELLVFSACLLLSLTCAGQSPATKIDNDFVHKQFGTEFNLVPEIPVSVGDLDGDGVEDCVIAARSRNPMMDQAEHNYAVIDPYMTFYGYGDPKVTISFGEGDPHRSGLVVLVIHGTGSQAWRSETPKAKYVIINLPYIALSIRKFMIATKHHKEQFAIYIEENNEIKETSAVYFDGKRYKYAPMGETMDW